MLEVMVRESRNVPARIWRAAFDGLLETVLRLHSRRSIAGAAGVGQRRQLRAARRRHLRSALPNARLLMCDEQVGHALHWEQPLRFANDLPIT